MSAIGACRTESTGLTLLSGSSPPPPHCIPHYLPQDFSKGQLLIVLEHGVCDSGGCLHAISVSLGDSSGTQVVPSFGVLSPPSSAQSSQPAGAAPHRPPIPGAVLIDGHDVVLPSIGPAGLSISRASSVFLILRWPGAQVLWEVSDPAAYSTLDPRYAHQVCWGSGGWLGEATVGPDLTVPCALLWPRCRVCAAPSPGTSRMTS